MLKYIPILLGGLALWFLFNNLKVINPTSAYTRGQVVEIVACFLVFVFGVKHAYKTHF